MDYLSNYYRNLCEQLQEKLNILETQLNEIKVEPNGKSSFDGMTTEQIRASMKETGKLLKIGNISGINKSDRIPHIGDAGPIGPGGIRPIKPGELKPKIPGLTPKTPRLPGFGIDDTKPSPFNPSKIFPSKIPSDLFRPGKRPAPKIGSTDETDEDIIKIRQTAADQGGIPQDMVDEPINRTKQLPDGRLIYGKSGPNPKRRPNIDGGPIIRKNPPPYPKPSPRDETMIPRTLDGFKKEQNFNDAMGLIPQTPEQRKRFGMSPFDNRMS